MPERATTRGWVWILTGLLAVLVVAATQFVDAEGLLERRPSWWRPLVLVPAHVLLLYCWWRLGPTFRRPLLAGALWSLPMMFALPMHSRDAYSYAAQGWLMSRGMSPYEVPSGEAGLPGLLVGVHWYDTTSVYPSLSLRIFELVDRLFDSQLYWTVVGLRLPNVLAFVLLAWALAKLAEHYGIDRTRVWWWGVANPVLLVQWIGGVHNDALMVALVAVALAMVVRPGWAALAVGGVALGAAMGIKQAAALAGLGLVAVAWQSRLRSGERGWPHLVATAAVPGATTVATFAALTLSSGLGMGWNAQSAGSPIGASSNAPLSWVASYFRYHEFAEPSQVNGVMTRISLGLVILSLVLLYLWLGPKADAPGRPWWFLILSLLSFGVLGPAMQPWYLTWVVPFIAFTRPGDRGRKLWWLVLLAFTMLPPLQDALPPYVAMGIVLVPLALNAWWWRRG